MFRRRGFDVVDVPCPAAQICAVARLGLTALASSSGGPLRTRCPLAEAVVGEQNSFTVGPGYGAEARGRVPDAGLALSRVRHVPCEVPARMTSVMRTRAAGSKRTYITEADTTHQQGKM